MPFNFFVTLGQPQIEQAVKTLGINSCEVSTAHLKFDYSPNDLQFAWFCLRNANSTYFQVRIIKK